MPGPKPRLHLPYPDWPAADRLLWEQAFYEDDPFSEMRLAKATKDGCMWSWRRFLGFLVNDEPEALQIAPAERLTTGRLKALVAHLAETNEPSSVANIIERLYMAARFMMPDHDWNWLRKIKLRLHAAVPAHSPAGPVITSVQLLEHGLALMDENGPTPDAPLDVRRAAAYRDGLISALLAFEPLRPKNLISLEIGRHLFLERGQWFVVVPRGQTKTKKCLLFQIAGNAGSLSDSLP